MMLIQNLPFLIDYPGSDFILLIIVGLNIGLRKQIDGGSIP